MTARFHTSAPDRWIMPRPTRDPMHNKYGPLLPMQEPRRSFLRFWRGGKKES